MEEIQSKRDNNSLNGRNQPTWNSLEELAKKKLSSTRDEFRCDCQFSTDSQVVRKKVLSKNLSKRSREMPKNRKNNKFTTKTQSRRKFNIEYDHSYQNVVNSSLCDQPRMLEKSIKTKNKIKNLDTTEVRSIEVTKRYPKSCCSALNRRTPKINRAKKFDRLGLSTDKRSLETSSSSPLSPVDGSSSITSDTVSIDESDNQETKKRDKKTKRFSYSLKNNSKYLDEQTYQRAARENRSQEASYKRQGSSPNGFENREMTHKAKNHQIEKLSHELFSKNLKLDKILQNQETEKLSICACDKIKTNNIYSVIDNCLKNSIHPDDVKNDSLFKKHHESHDTSSSIFMDGGYAKPEELIPSKKNDDSLFDKSCITSMNLQAKSPQLWQKFEQNLESISANYREISSGLKEMRREVTENEKIETKEKMIQEYPIRKLTFKTQIDRDDLDSVHSLQSMNNSSKNNITNTSLLQDNQKITSKAVDRQQSLFSSQKKHDPTCIINLTDKLTINNQDVTSNQLEAASESCQFEFCNCDPLNHKKESTEKSTSSLGHNFSISRERSRERVKRHDFSLPKIVVPESSEQSDIRKFFVYTSEENQEPPLVVYRTSSYVKCDIKKNKNIGFRYVLTYVQKYVSPTWKPDQQNKRKTTSNIPTDLLK